MDFDNYLHIPPKTPAILQSHRYHHVMPSSSGVGLVDAAASSELIVWFSGKVSSSYPNPVFSAVAT